ncbi:MAG: ATP-binding cassette domain-containing protein [Alphaproteobacteria bacterium]
MSLLATHALYKSFGQLVVADGIDFELGPGDRHALIGPNGAGKTTFVNLLTGALAPSDGRVMLDGRDITRLGEAQRVKRGLVRTFQINQLFAGLTVLENVALAVAERRGAASVFWTPLRRRADLIDEAADLLVQLDLTAVADTAVAAVPYGLQRMLELALALALKPRVLLLDEPTAGVPSAESHRMLEAVEALGQDLAVLIIEHDMDVVFRFASAVTVLVGGKVLVQGAPDEIARNADVRAVYLAESRDD